MRLMGFDVTFVLFIMALNKCLVGAGSSRSDSKPNIVIMLADDLGYGDIGAYGHPTSHTPHLDQMAAEGLVFTQFYTASPVCSPSRAALLTGRYQTRSGIYPNVLNPNMIGGLPLNETTLAEALKDEGYSTGMVGKWHLGVGANNMYLPTRQGFDYYMGIPYSHDECPSYVCFYPDQPCINSSLANSFVPCPLFENEKIIQQPANLLQITSSYINAATSFIKTKAAAKTPFFLCMAFQHTHKPQFAGKQFANTTLRGAFGDALAELDWGVGEVMQALEDANIEDNTLVFFTSDNGPALYQEILGGNAGPLRCGKGTTWEGGQRVPAIAHWPGKIEPGRTFELAATLDIFPTIVKLVGAKLPDVTLDGFDMAPILFESDKSNRNYYIYYPNDVTEELGIAAIRINQYKAHYHSHGYFCVNTYPDYICRTNYTRHMYDPPLLFDLHTDPSEHEMLDVKEYSDIMDEIHQLKQKFESKMVWGESQMEKGTSNSVEPCATPGCSPFPGCCKTQSTDFDLHFTSRVIP